MNGVWKAQWKKSVNDFKGFMNQSSKVAGIFSLGQNVGFKDLEENIIELLEYEEEMSMEDLTNEEEKQEFTELHQQTMKRLAHFFTLAELLAQEVVDMDLNLEGSLHFERT